MSEPQEDYTTKDDRAYWGKLEIMGHETYYGRILELDHGRIEIDIIPTGGEPGDELHTKKFGPSAIFGIEPLAREECYTLAGRDHYEASPLDYAEQQALVEGSYDLDEAIDEVERNDYRAIDKSQIRVQAEKIAVVAAMLHMAEPANEDLESVMNWMVDSLESAMGRAIHRAKAKSLIQQAITELPGPSDETIPPADLLEAIREGGIEIDFDEASPVHW